MQEGRVDFCRPSRTQVYEELVDLWERYFSGLAPLKRQDSYYGEYLGMAFYKLIQMYKLIVFDWEHLPIASSESDHAQVVQQIVQRLLLEEANHICSCFVSDQEDLSEEEFMAAHLDLKVQILKKDTLSLSQGIVAAFKSKKRLPKSTKQLLGGYESCVSIMEELPTALNPTAATSTQ